MIIQSPVKRGAVLDALRTGASPNVIEIRLAVAYVAQSGVTKFVEMMEEQLGPLWNSISKQLVTCIDFGFTDPEALRQWRKLHQATVFLHNTGVKNNLLRPSRAFHSKYYEFRETGSTTIAIGSANLSKAAFTSNYEVLSLTTLQGNLSAAEAAWRTLKKNAVIATPDLIDAYENRRLNIAIPASNAIYINTRPELRLWEAIEAGLCPPKNYKFFWVDAGSMSSGGSANQLELPRGGHRFFGGTVSYTSKSKKILDVLISFSGSSYLRPISWHGSNKMERLNLPPGPNYANRVILFERHGNVYRLLTAPVGSLHSMDWADRSEAIDQIFRVGKGSSRRCGFF